MINQMMEKINKQRQTDENVSEKILLIKVYMHGNVLPMYFQWGNLMVRRFFY